MRTARAARAVQLSGACVRANKERGYPSVENFWNDLNKLLSDFYKVTVYKGRWVQYLEGLGMTIALAALACLIGVCIGVLVALVKYYAGGKKSFGWKTVNAACGIYVTVIRGTPIVVQLLIAYTILFNGSFEACVFAFGVNSGAYVAEIIRGGIASIDPGQAEAGRSLGLSEGATMRLIVLPQAVKNILPALFNEFIALLKETSVAGYIAARDLTKVDQHGEDKSYKHSNSDTPLIKEQPHADDQGMDEAARHLLQDCDRIVLHIRERGGHSGGDISQAIFVEIAHRDPLHVLSDFKPLFSAHGKAAQSAPVSGQIVEHDPPQDTDYHNSQRYPDGLRRHDAAIGSSQQASEYRKDGQDGQHLEYRVQ
ncbi:amino acid ABC transporter permease [Ruthenibacterium lactatiformans]|nr:amino acid ABC transporter permease [Ruthenibacterium lactatiformans]